MYLDTLAESLWSAGRFRDAVSVGGEALAEAGGSADAPSRDYLARQLAKYEASAGGGTQGPHPAGPGPPPAGTADLP
ncbi:MAG: hypothetical protein FJ087_21545 [Deltaproteobacteria bacterium]|nr:hypothetical protein [Deltaproteobacteria bacterium]